MKTAVQMMLDDLISKREVYENAKMYQCVATLETSIELAEYLLEKEKEQIKTAFESGWNWNFSSEKYYQETYKNQTP